MRIIMSNGGASVQLPLNEIRFTFSRASGPGGQNVNKVSSRATLHWDLSSSKRFPPSLKERFSKLFANRIDKHGWVNLTSQEYRDQRRNIEACLKRLEAMLRQAAVVPKSRRPTRPTTSSRLKRHEAKRRRTIKKGARARVRDDD